MGEIYLDLLCGVCLFLLAWGLKKSERIYQYPFWMGVVFSAFILPQAFALVRAPGVISPSGIRGVLIMSSLCAGMCWLGYTYNPSISILKKINFSVDENKLFKAGVFLMLFGCSCQTSLNFIPIQIDPATGNWTGSATIVYFLGQTSYTGLIIVLQRYLRRPNTATLIFMITTFLPILTRIILGGRRSPTAGILLIVGISLLFEKGIKPNRAIVISAVILLPALIPLLGELRFGFWQDLVAGQITPEILIQSFNHLLDGKVLELRNAAFIVEVTEQSGNHGFGIGYWNAFVHQYVPGQIVGSDFKQSLKLNISVFDYVSAGAKYGIYYHVYNGSTTTGVGDAFLEFSYFGCLVFAIVSLFLKTIWVSSMHFRNSFNRIVYISIMCFSHWIVTHGTYTFFATNLVFNVLCLGTVYQYAKLKKHPANTLNSFHSR